MNRRIVVGITGASGAAYAQRIIEGLTAAGVETHVAITAHGKRLLHDELGLSRPDIDVLSGGRADRVVVHNDNDLGAPIASGTFRHDGMVVVPASSNTLGGIATGRTDTLVQRAALVALKERRKLVIAHRETPLTLIDLRNMVTLTESGAIIAPLNPGFYLGPKTVQEVIDFMAAKVLDLLDVEHDFPRWGDD